MIGNTLGNYEILGALGKGGMGEVYRARDSKLGREVAIKVLPRELSGDPERVARFDREARLLASLQHANVASIYNFEQQNGVQFLAMELVEGQTLEERLRLGAPSRDEVVRVALQIAAGLEAAHEKGIVHRDLKPANVMLTRNGDVKILDFGLARAWFGDGTDDSELSNSPTITTGMTQAGVILGTAAYMSPEQAHGRLVDRRSDIWSFGCVLFELLTAKPLFVGESISDTLASVLRSQPDFEALPNDLPRRIRTLLDRCLTRDPKQRLQSIGEARIVLQAQATGVVEEADASPALPTGEPSHRSWRWPIATLVAVLAVGLTGFVIGRSGQPAIQPTAEPLVTRLELPVPSDRPIASGSFLNPLAVSPDGRILVYVGVEAGTRQLYRRPLNQLSVEPIPGTEGAEGPFFSPDGEEVAFWAAGRVQRVSVTGGLPRPVFSSVDYRGGVWLPDGTIVVSPSQQGPLYRFPEDGGDATPLTADGPGFQHRLPSLLPDGRILFGIRTGDRFAYDNASLVVLWPDTGQMQVVADGVGMDGRYAAGNLFYVQANSLIARPFDLEALEFTGPPLTVHHGVQVQTNTGAAQFVLTPDGSLAFLPGEAIGNDTALARVDRDGSSEYLSIQRDVYRWPSMTADGLLNLIVISEQRGGRWATSLEEPGLTRMNIRGGYPVWAPDGKHIATASDSDEPQPKLYYFDQFSDTEPTILFTAPPDVPLRIVPTSFSPDGKSLLFGIALATDNIDVYVTDVEDPTSTRPFLDSESVECGARFSPDGRWVAYVSDGSGRLEVWVTDWPSNRLRQQISTDGGREPVWSPDGDELFFRSGERMMSARVRGEDGFKAETPQVLFIGDYEGILGFPDLPNYTVAPDGRFLMLRSRELASTSDRIAFVHHAITALETRPNGSGR